MLIKISKKIVLIFFLLLTVSVLNHFSGMGVNHLDIDTSELEFERILFVPGINTPKFYLVRWGEDLNVNFPNKEIIFLDNIYYFYWQDDKTEEIVEKGVEILSDGKPTIIISHSYGGVLAETMISRTENSQVVKLITMASPHQMNGLGLDESKDFLGVPDEIDVPTYSFGGYIDPVVLYPFSSAGDSNHQDLWSGHSGFLFSKDIRRQVLEHAFGTSTTWEID
jgi:hypothetical protein